MTGLFANLHHICVVVHDLDKAVEYYASLGVGPFYDYPKGGEYVRFDVPNPQASADTRYRCADFDNVQLQLCQPSLLDSPQRRFLDEHGEGVYHLGFETPDVAAAKAAGEQLGLGVIASGERVDGGGFCYFDTRRDAGVVLEVRAGPRAE